ncbi:MAG: HAD family phosphatase [Lachnospiraceae bacterium]|nr:HAD family phosphatase [Lachnospiraceae bacterium]
MLKSIIFDMDGVLVNSEPVHYQAYLMALEPWGKTFSYEEYKTYVGTTNAVIIDGLIEKFGLPIDRDSFNERMKEKKAYLYERDGYPGVEGVPEMLACLKAAGYSLAVASSSPYENIIRATKALGIYSYFDVFVSGESVEHPKPAPDVFLKAAEALKTAPENCLVVEDSCHGVHAAKNAGMASLGFVNPDSGDQDLSCATRLTVSFLQVDNAFVEEVYQEWKRKREKK